MVPASGEAARTEVTVRTVLVSPLLVAEREPLHDSCIGSDLMNNAAQRAAEDDEEQLLQGR